MNIAIVVEREAEVWKLLDDGFLVLKEEAERRGHKVDYCHLVEGKRIPNYQIFDNINNYDFIMHSLHANKETKHFMDNIPENVTVAHFPHDTYSVQDDIGTTAKHTPDIIFTCFKPHLRTVKEEPRFASAKIVPCRWWKLDLLDRFQKKRNDKLIVVVDAWDLPEDPNAYPYWEQHGQKPIPGDEICDYFSSHGFDVAIKGVIKPKRCGTYTTSYLKTKGTIECMQEAAFTIDQGSGMSNEVFLGGCIPILVAHKEEEVMKMIPTRQETIVNYYKRYIHVASPLREHFPMKGVISYIPGITREFDTLNILDKIRDMDRDAVLRELNDFWAVDPGEPFYVTALREIENAGRV
jgi:hypothetical protein